MLLGMSRGARSLSDEEAAKVRVLLNELVREHGSQTAVAKVIGQKQQHISNVLGGKGVGYALGRAVAAASGVMDFDAWLRGRTAGAAAPRLRDVDGYAEGLPEARIMFRSVPEYAFQAIGEIMGENLPKHLTPMAIGLLASGWHEAAGDKARSAAIVANAEREMNEEDGLFATKPK